MARTKESRSAMRKSRRVQSGERGRTEGPPPAACQVSGLYAEVTARIIADLEAGTFPWARPWDSSSAAIGLPCNAATSRPYSGINVLILWGALQDHGYSVQRWLTFRQALEAGGNVRKGEHGVTVFFADRFIPAAEKERAERDGDTPNAIPFLKRFTLFNVAQCENLPGDYSARTSPRGPRETVPVAEALIAASKADIRIGGDKAYYAPAGDYIVLPPQDAFRHQINFYRTALHELGHWTGHGTRLGRDQTASFGSPGYAREELVAELCAAFTCAALGIQPIVRHADYLASWLAVLREDERAIFKAASLASKAADYLLALRASEPG